MDNKRNNKRTDVRVRLNEKQYKHLILSKEMISERYGEQFNMSRFVRLCLNKMNDDAFLIEVGYFNERVEVFKKLGLPVPT